MTYDGGRIWCSRCKAARPRSEYRRVQQTFVADIVRKGEGVDWNETSIKPVMVWEHKCGRFAVVMLESEAIT